MEAETKNKKDLEKLYSNKKPKTHVFSANALNNLNWMVPSL